MSWQRPRVLKVDPFCAFCKRALGSYALWDERLICTGCLLAGLSVKKR